MGGFYIHLEDPGFPEHPWPGVRRLGPFNTRDDALEQAVSDAAQGMGVAQGVYSEAESEKRYTGRREGRAEFSRAEIRKRAEPRAKKLRDAQIAAHQQIVKDIEATLPPGVGWEDLVELARAQQARVGEFQTFRTPLYDAPVQDGEAVLGG